MKRVLIILLILGVLTVGVGGWFFVQSASVLMLSWKTASVETGDMKIKVTASGTVEPLSTVQVGSQVSGKVKVVNVQPDDLVKKDEVIAVLDSELLEADLRDRRVMLEKVRTSLDMIEVEYNKLELREARLKLNRKRGAIALSRAEATLRLAGKNLQAYQDLFDKGAKSQTELDIRILEKENAERDVSTRKLDLSNLDVDLKQIAIDRKALDARKRNARNDVSQAEQAVAKAETNLNHASIRSPIAGVVLERTINPGQTIAAQFQSPNLFKIAEDLGRVHIKVHIDEADVGKVRPGQKVTFEVDAYRDVTFDGNVTAVRLKHELRGNLVTYPVVIEAANPMSDAFPRGQLRPGMTAYVTFIVETKEKVVRLPADALRFTPPKDAVQVDVEGKGDGEEEASGKKGEKDPEDGEGKSEDGKNGEKEKKLPGMPVTVYVVGEEGKLRPVPIRVGENDGKFYELLSGELKENDEVVTGSAAGKAGRTGVKMRRHRRRR